MWTVDGLVPTADRVVYTVDGYEPFTISYAHLLLLNVG